MDAIHTLASVDSDLASAISTHAETIAGPDGFILVTGSLSVAAAACDVLHLGGF